MSNTYKKSIYEVANSIRFLLSIIFISVLTCISIHDVIFGGSDSNRKQHNSIETVSYESNSKEYDNMANMFEGKEDINILEQFEELTDAMKLEVSRLTKITIGLCVWFFSILVFFSLENMFENNLNNNGYFYLSYEEREKYKMTKYKKDYVGLTVSTLFSTLYMGTWIVWIVIILLIV